MTRKKESDMIPLTFEVEEGLHKAVKQTALDKGLSIRKLLTPVVEKVAGWSPKAPVSSQPK